MRYAVIIEEGENSFGAYAPDLPGCVALGETKEEVLKLIEEAIEFQRSGCAANKYLHFVRTNRNAGLIALSLLPSKPWLP